MSYPSFISEVGAIAMGSATYLWILRNLEKLESAVPQPWPYQQPTWVFFSGAQPAIPGADIRFVHGDVRPVHQEMAAGAAGRRISGLISGCKTTDRKRPALEPRRHA
ncbi:MAG TPA: hypothetical protein VNN09_04645 [Candidatus Competibacteraceae bacterium]|nr:hypothetical protein [Candidatus Competibacteraceae bacterium]